MTLICGSLLISHSRSLRQGEHSSFTRLYWRPCWELLFGSACFIERREVFVRFVTALCLFACALSVFQMPCSLCNPDLSECRTPTNDRTDRIPEVRLTRSTVYITINPRLHSVSFSAKNATLLKDKESPFRSCSSCCWAWLDLFRSLSGASTASLWSARAHERWRLFSASSSRTRAITAVERRDHGCVSAKPQSLHRKVTRSRMTPGRDPVRGYTPALTPRQSNQK